MIDISKISNIKNPILPSTSENLVKHLNEENKWGIILNNQTFDTINNNISILKNFTMEIINNMNQFITINSLNDILNFGDKNKKFNFLTKQLQINGEDIDFVLKKDLQDINKIAYTNIENEFTENINTLKSYKINNKTVLNENNDNIDVGNNSKILNILTKDNKFKVNNEYFKMDEFIENNVEENKLIMFKFNIPISKLNIINQEEYLIKTYAKIENGLTIYTSNSILNYDLYIIRVFEVRKNDSLIFFSEGLKKLEDILFKNVKSENRTKYKGLKYNFTIFDNNKNNIYTDNSKIFILNPPFELPVNESKFVKNFKSYKNPLSINYNFKSLCMREGFEGFGNLECDSTILNIIFYNSYDKGQFNEIPDNVCNNTSIHIEMKTVFFKEQNQRDVNKNKNIFSVISENINGDNIVANLSILFDNFKYLFSENNEYFNFNLYNS